MKLQLAQGVAAEIIQALKPDCVQIQEAGSIRRLKPEVKDVEIVYISKTGSRQMDLFGLNLQTYFHVDHTLLTLIADGILAKDPTTKRWGPKYKRAIHCASGIVVELFRTEPDNWGYILALRTGPDKFNKLLVTKHAHGGALPPDIILRGGNVWLIGRCPQETLIPAPTEHSFFAALNLPHIPPQERTVEYLQQLIQERQNQ